MPGQDSPVEDSVAFPGAITLLLVDTPGCRSCTENYPAWIRLAEKIGQLRSRVRVVLVRTVESQESVWDLAGKVGARAVITANAHSLIANRMHNYTPLTIVVDSSGMTKWMMPGPLRATDIAAAVESLSAAR